jgi:hypothetical protein
MASALIVNTTRQSPTRNRIPATPLSAFTSPTGLRENRQFAVDLRARSGGKLAPLADSGGRKANFFHIEKSHSAMHKSRK